MTGISLFLLLALVVAVVTFAPETDIGKALRRALVIAPAKLLNDGPLKALVSLVVVLGLILFAMAAPEMVAMLGMADLSLYLDVVVLSFILGAASGFRSIGHRAVRVAMRLFGALRFAPRRMYRTGSRHVRARKPRRPPPPADGRWRGEWATA